MGDYQRQKWWMIIQNLETANCLRSVLKYRLSNIDKDWTIFKIVIDHDCVEHSLDVSHTISEVKYKDISFGIHGTPTVPRKRSLDKKKPKNWDTLWKCGH